jgi:3-hydroxyacyl-[acyl-carrier-protein] dehydratase
VIFDAHYLLNNIKMNIQKRLHHRPPYLLIDEVIEHSSEVLIAKSLPQGEEFYLKGHFPGSPVVPGAIMQEMTTQAAGLLITEHYSPVPDYDSNTTKGWALGVLRAVHLAKYKHFARPGDILQIRVELIDNVDNSFRFKGKIEVQGKNIMFNEFTLINIDERKLKG